MNFTRRNIVTAAVSTAAIASAGSCFGSGIFGRAAAQEVNAFDLAKPVPLGDVVLGSATAPVTMIEYASMSCGHCAEFNKTTFPTIKAAFIDTGKLRFVFREYPLNLPSAVASMLTRCASKGDPDRYHEIAGILFAAQDEWVPKDTAEHLRRIIQQTGMNDAVFDACLSNQTLIDGLQQGRDHASEKLKVNSTPTFFINGVRLNGALPTEEFRKVIEANLKS